MESFAFVIQSEKRVETEIEIDPENPKRTVCQHFKLGRNLHTGDTLSQIWIYPQLRIRPFPGRKRKSEPEDLSAQAEGSELLFKQVEKGYGRRDKIRVMLCSLTEEETGGSVLINWTDLSDLPTGSGNAQGPNSFVSNELGLVDAQGHKIELPVAAATDSDLTLILATDSDLDDMVRFQVICKVSLLPDPEASSARSLPQKWLLTRKDKFKFQEPEDPESPPSTCCLAKKPKKRALSPREPSPRELPGDKYLVWDPSGAPGKRLRCTQF